jgi:molybdate transport system ATP-binding protein
LANLFPPSPPQILAVNPHISRLSVRLRHNIGKSKIDIDFELTHPWTILFGPSGSGKTTILRAITGLFEPDFANIVSYPRLVSPTKTGITLIDTSTSLCLPPHKRGMVLASQKPSLFPHMTVLQNIRFGYPRAASSAEQDHLDELNEIVPKLFRIEHLLQQRPDELSGGETQRVHLARATMARRIHVLLLDEPFTGLDRELRDELITDLLAWQERSQVPILSVTHDVTEAFQLGADVIKIAEGRVVRQGPVAEVLAGERERLLEQLNALKESRA